MERPEAFAETPQSGGRFGQRVRVPVQADQRVDAGPQQGLGVAARAHRRVDHRGPDPEELDHLGHHDGAVEAIQSAARPGAPAPSRTRPPRPGSP